MSDNPLPIDPDLIALVREEYGLQSDDEARAKIEEINADPGSWSLDGMPYHQWHDEHDD